MMGSSKYEFEPELFEIDIEDKRKVAKQFKKDLENILYSDYFYHDNSCMSYRAKREILIQVYLGFINKVGE